LKSLSVTVFFILKRENNTTTITAPRFQFPGRSLWQTAVLVLMDRIDAFPSQALAYGTGRIGHFFAVLFAAGRRGNEMNRYI
jgi:hypothetical protein